MARWLLMLAGAALLAQEPAVEKTRAAIEAALAEQRKSMAAAAASLAAQRDSVERQQEAAGRFVISPAPALPPAGAMEAMQLMPASARLLKEMLTRYGDGLALALNAYNAGGAPQIPEAVDDR